MLPRQATGPPILGAPRLLGTFLGVLGVLFVLAKALVPRSGPAPASAIGPRLSPAKRPCAYSAIGPRLSPAKRPSTYPGHRRAIRYPH